MEKSKIWYVEFPTYQYNEDVKELAKKNGLKIIDTQFDAGDGEKDVPKLTKVGEKDVPKLTKTKGKKQEQEETIEESVEETIEEVKE